tara:strand:+ start:448 stop:1281 length:834 start_codon:yes stop_codon:yes gene_type:complete
MSIENFINLESIDKNLKKYFKKYNEANPFPHIILDNFLTEDCISKTLEGYEKVNWTSYIHFNENKSGNKTTNFDPLLSDTIGVLNSREFLDRLEKITGIKSLIPDHELGSGGVHRSTTGGYLNIHADFTVHPYNHDWHRRVNVLIYLNKKWDNNWGGQLELWDKKMENCITKISPIFNRCVIFNTDYNSFHGHPEPMRCPKNTYRKSIALYYYTKTKKEVKTIATNYKPRPKDSFLKRFLIYIDKSLVSIFHFLKMKFKLSDTFFTTINDLLKIKKK